MNDVTLAIDGKEVTVPEGTTLLEAARKVGADIPTLCDCPELKPAGTCRMCMVEITRGTRKKLVASCVYPVEDGLVVVTENARIIKHRKLLIELLWPAWVREGKRYCVTGSRFRTADGDCSQCGLCVRYCSEVAKKNVVYFAGRGVKRHLAFVPGSEDECASCQQCFRLCTGGWLVSHQGVAQAE